MQNYFFTHKHWILSAFWYQEDFLRVEQLKVYYWIKNKLAIAMKNKSVKYYHLFGGELQLFISHIL